MPRLTRRAGDVVAQACPAGAARDDALPTREYDLVTPTPQTTRAADGIDANDGRAMYSRERRGIEPSSERVERFAVQERAAGRMEADVVADGFDPVHVGDGNEVVPPDAADDDLGRPRGAWRALARGGVTRQIAR